MNTYCVVCCLVFCILTSCNKHSVSAQAPQGDVPKPQPQESAAALHNDRLTSVQEALSALPPSVADEAWKLIQQDAPRFFSLMDAALDESDKAGGLFTLVDKHNALPPDYVPHDLVSLNDYPLLVTRNDLSLRKAIMPSLLAMNAAAKADGIKLVFGSSYRSFKYQDSLFKRYAASHGEAEAARFSARPGMSQHQLGTVVDFSPINDSFAKTPAGVWTAANAGRFGFSLSFPPGMESITGYVWESWHFRYITQPGIQLETRYFGGMQQYLIEFLNALRR